MIGRCAALLVIGVLLAVPAATAGAAPVRHSAQSRQCTQLEALTKRVLTSLTLNGRPDTKQARRIARKLRDLAKSELTPERVTAAERKLARFFDRMASGKSIVELAKHITPAALATVTIVEYTATGCGRTA